MIANFADFCLMMYVAIDDHYRAVPASVKPRGVAPGCSDSELLTMLLVGACMGWHEESVHVSQWQHHRDLFPHQPDRTRLNRRRRALTAALTLLRRRVLATLALAQDRQCVVDSVPVPVIGFHLVPGARSANDGRAWGADYGKVCTKKQTIFGDKLHLLVTLGGVIRDCVLAPASAHDSTIAPELLGGQRDVVVIGDTGYVSAPLAVALQQERGVTLLTPRRRNQRDPLPRALTKLWKGLRQVIETVNDQLSEQFALGRDQARTFRGLAARLETKLTAHTMCIALNWQVGKAAWLQIKVLAFPIST
jgi:IS5 family transposase